MSQYVSVELSIEDYRKIIRALDNECVAYSFSLAQVETGYEMYLNAEVPHPGLTLKLMGNKEWKAFVDLRVGE